MSQTRRHMEPGALSTLYRPRELTGPANSPTQGDTHTHTIPHLACLYYLHSQLHPSQSWWSLLCLTVIQTLRHTHKYINSPNTNSYILTPVSACQFLSLPHIHPHHSQGLACYLYMRLCTYICSPHTICLGSLLNTQRYPDTSFPYANTHTQTHRRTVIQSPSAMHSSYSLNAAS